MSDLDKLLDVITVEDYLLLYHLTPPPEFNQVVKELVEVYEIE